MESASSPAVEDHTDGRAPRRSEPRSPERVGPRARTPFASLAAFSALVLCIVVVVALRGPGYSRVAYDWDTVEINGGGWVTGLVTTASGATYARTDVGGAYRWDAERSRWEQMLTYEAVDTADKRDYYVESLAVAPSDDGVLYMAVGDSLKERSGRVLSSEDGGHTWSRSSQSFTIHGNAQWRQAGARLAVDPEDPDVVMLGTRQDGLWRSVDGGEEWLQVRELPAPIPLDEEAPAGITFVAFSPGSEVDGRSQDMWAGVEGKGIFRSEDAGTTWSLIHATPQGLPRDAEVASDGRLYVALAGRSAGVVRLGPGDAEAEDISPGGTPAVVAVDPSDPDRLFVGDEGIRSGYLWRSTDGGDSWETLDTAVTAKDDAWPLQSDLDEYMSAGELTFDPARPGTLWFAEGMGVWRSGDLGDGEVTWEFTSTGIEELVTNDAVVPAEGDLLTAHWDRNVFRHPEGGPAELALTGRFNSAWSLAVTRADPDFVAAVVDDHRFCCDDDGLAGQSGTSEDGGRTWHRFPSLEAGQHPDDLRFGNIAISETDKDNMVWVPSNGGRVHFTRDGGTTWTAAEYSGSEPHFAHYLHRQVLVADPRKDGTFYVLDKDGIMRSTDGGATWQKRRSEGLPGPAALRFNATLKAVPTRSGSDLVMTTGLLDEGSYGLFRSGDGGETWHETAGLADVGRVGVAGAPGPDGTYALFATGEQEGDTGLWRSTDGARTWSLIDEAPAGRYQDVTVLVGTPGSPDEVIVGFTGTGAVRGRAS